MRALLLTALVAAGPCWPDTDLMALTPAERAALGTEVRALLLAEPKIVEPALTPPSPATQEIRQEIEDDQQLLHALAPDILAGRQIALFIGEECAECDRAVKELDELSKDYGAKFMLHDTNDAASAALAAKLGMTDLPFYVLPDMILRGHIPQVVLPRYLD